MAGNLTALLPTDGLVRLYLMLDGIDADGESIGFVDDTSGNTAHMVTLGGSDYAAYEYPSLNGRPSIKFEENDPPSNDTDFTAREIYVVAKWDGGATFGANERGLISDIATNVLLVGQAGQTKFFNLSPLVYTYRKSGTIYAANNMQAPIDNFELVQLTNSTGWSLDAIQIGQDRSDPTRRWTGRVAALAIYSTVSDEMKQLRINLFFDLYFGLWEINNTILNFPAQQITGILYNRFYEFPRDWSSVTTSHEYEDGGRSFKQTADTCPRRWEIGFTGLTPEEAEIFDAFNDAAKRKNTFNFLDKFGETHEGVRIESYERNHDEHKSRINNCFFRLVQYP